MQERHKLTLTPVHFAVPLIVGIPQVSVLDTFLFTLYTCPIGVIYSNRWFKIDHIPLYTSIRDSVPPGLFPGLIT